MLDYKEKAAIQLSSSELNKVIICLKLKLFYCKGCVHKLTLNRCVRFWQEILNSEENETTDSNVKYSI
jgi:hypothetical protein